MKLLLIISISDPVSKPVAPCNTCADEYGINLIGDWVVVGSSIIISVDWHSIREGYEGETIGTLKTKGFDKRYPYSFKNDTLSVFTMEGKGLKHVRPIGYNY
jgi:hypothetical protein